MSGCTRPWATNSPTALATNPRNAAYVFNAWGLHAPRHDANPRGAYINVRNPKKVLMPHPFGWWGFKYCRACMDVNVNRAGVVPVPPGIWDAAPPNRTADSAMLLVYLSGRSSSATSGSGSDSDSKSDSKSESESDSMDPPASLCTHSPVPGLTWAQGGAATSTKLSATHPTLLGPRVINGAPCPVNAPYRQAAGARAARTSGPTSYWNPNHPGTTAGTHFGSAGATPAAANCARTRGAACRSAASSNAVPRAATSTWELTPP